MHIHSIWRLWNTLCVFNIDKGSSLEWVYSLSHCTMLWFALGQVSRFLGVVTSKRGLLIIRAAAMLKGQLHDVHIHIIWRLWNTVCVLDIDVGAHLNGSLSSIITLAHCSLPLGRGNHHTSQKNSRASPIRAVVTLLRTAAYEYPKHVLRLWNTLCVVDAEVRAHLNGSIAWITTLWCGLFLGSTSINSLTPSGAHTRQLF